MKLSSILSLAGAAFASAAAAQSSTEPPAPNEIPAVHDNSMSKAMDDAERDRVEAKLNDHEARMALQHYGSCVVGKSEREAARILSMDFTTSKYRSGLRLLSDDSAKFCANPSFGTGVLRSANLLFAGEVAEALLEGSGPVASQLAKAAAGPATPGYALTDKVAICVVRSVPDQVAAVFSTERDTAEETAAINALSMPVQMCARAAQAIKPMSISPAGLRAMLATAAFRSVHAPGTAS
jgi:hypothetical protein